MADDEYSFLTPRSHQEDQAHGQGVTMAKRPRLSEEGRVSVLDALVSGPEAEDTLTSEAATICSSTCETRSGSGFSGLDLNSHLILTSPSSSLTPSSSLSCQVDQTLLDSSALCLTPASSVEDSSCSGPAACPSQENPEDEDDDDDASSDISDLSCLSGLSGSDWKPLSGPIKWIQQQMSNEDFSPRDILEQLLPNETISPDCDRMTLFRVLVSMLSQPPMRKRLLHVNSMAHVVDLISRSKNIIVLTGAGVSVSCGIPDFRSRDGIYARLSKEFPTLPDPQSMFDIHYFRRDPRPFFKFAKEIYPGQFEPSPSHKFIKLLENHGKLLRNYTQNIDTLEQTAGIDKVINCHGSFATASCTRCRFQVKAQDIREDIFAQRIPLCPKCPPDSFEMAVMKPDIVFFGEGLSDEFHQAMTTDKDDCDLLLVMGSSLKVRPVALIPSSIQAKVPQVLINREPLDHMNFDVELLGDCDIIVRELANRLGSSWTSISKSQELLKEMSLSDLMASKKIESSEATPDRSSLDDSMSSSLSSMNEESIPPDTTSCSRRRKSLADGLPDDSYLFIPPSRYVFKGAEVYEKEEDDEDDDDDEEGNEESSCSRSTEDSTCSGEVEKDLDDKTSVHKVMHHPQHSLLIEVPSKWEKQEKVEDSILFEGHDHGSV